MIRQAGSSGYRLIGFESMEVGRKTRAAPAARPHPRNETVKPDPQHRIEIPSWKTRPQRLWIVLPLAVLLASLPGTASARDTAARKLGRGVANLSLGVLAIPGEIVETTRENGPFVGATWGFTKGVGMLVASEVVGLWEVLTCPFETPPRFEPILEPEFPWGYFYESDRARSARALREARRESRSSRKR